MAAPDAPVIRTMQNGYGVISVFWPAVVGATSYKVYSDPTASATTQAATVTTALSDGSFVYLTTLPGAGPAYLRVKATNSDGDSGYSNERLVNVTSGVSDQESSPALKHVKATQ